MPLQIATFLHRNALPLVGALMNATSLFVGLYGQSVPLKAISGSLGSLGILCTILMIRPLRETGPPTDVEMGQVPPATNDRHGYQRMPSGSPIGSSAMLSPFRDDASPPSRHRARPRSDANAAAVFPPDSPPANPGKARTELKEIGDKFQFILEYTDDHASDDPVTWRSFVAVNNQEMGSGVAHTKAAARDAAAREAVQRLKEQNFAIGNR